MKSLFVSICLATTLTGVFAQAPEPAAGYHFSVKAMKAVDIPADTSREWMAFFGPGIASGALGVVAPPLFASGLVVGGLLLMPSALVMSDREHRQWEQVAHVLQNVPLENQLLDALQRRAIRTLHTEPGTAVHVTLDVDTYGIVGARPQQLCFVARANLIVQTRQETTLQAALSISPGQRSPDAPPPQCASLDRFSERHGQLVQDTATEYIEVLAAMVIDRLRPESER